MTTLERAHNLAADFYIFSAKPRLADRTIVSTDDLTAFSVVLAADPDAAYLADCRVPQLLVLPTGSVESHQLAPGAILEPRSATATATPQAVTDAYQDINTALKYAIARETQRNGGQLTEEQAAILTYADTELKPIVEDAHQLMNTASTTEPVAPSDIAPAASTGINEVGVELTALQIRQLISQQISEPELITAAITRLRQKQGSVLVMDGRAELLYSEEAQTFVAAMEPRDKRAFDDNLTTLQATAMPSADDIEAAAFDEADSKERSL